MTKQPAQIPPIDRNIPNNIQTATLAAGCFWGVETQFACFPGVIRTRVGYSGGTSENPTYTHIGDHIETVQIDFDPQQITYTQLLKHFWLNHDPLNKPYKRQYQAVIFTHDKRQADLAKASFQQQLPYFARKLTTEMLPYQHFYLAEDYHQKYHLRLEPELCQEMQRIYPELLQFINSTAVTRINGYSAKQGDAALFEDEIHTLGLSEASQQRLTKLFKNVL